MPPELRRIWFIWISWISWVCMQLSSLSHLVTESERLLIQTLTQNVITHHEEKKWYWISVVFLIVPISAFFVFFGSLHNDMILQLTAKRKKKHVWHVWLLEFCVLMVLPSVQCFWEIIQLLAMCVLLIRRFHSCECYWPWGLLYTGSCSMWQLFLYRLAFETRTPPPSPPQLYIFLLMVEKARRIVGVESACLWLASVITLGYFNYVYLSNTDYKGYSIERNVAWKMFIP